jgi:hypothetical protein
MTTDNDDRTDDDPEAGEVITCGVCGVAGAVVVLDDGTHYCTAHRGLTTHDSGPQAVPEVDNELRARVAEAIGADLTAEPQPTDDHDPDVWARDPAVLMLAGLVIEGALNTFGEDGVYGDPPLGWAPSGDGTLAVVEAGAILAVATIIEAAGIEREPLRKLSAVFRGETDNNERENSD